MKNWMNLSVFQTVTNDFASKGKDHMNILQEIAQRTKQRIETQKINLPLQRLMEITSSDAAANDFPFEKAIRRGETKDVSFICEIKKASPSKGIIAEDFPYIEIARDYEAAGAAAISVLTEPYYFKGSDQYLREIANAVSIPLLRKDFTVDSYMIYEAKMLGASAVLLICSILDQETLTQYIEISHSLGLSALVEAHDEAEIKMALNAGARVIGVNNRDLKTFTIDMNNSIRLRKQTPNHIIFVSESGIQTAEDVEILRQNKVDAALIGETLMRSPDKKAMLSKLKGNSFTINSSMSTS